MRCFLSPWPDPRTQQARVSTLWLGVDQDSRIEQPLRIQGCLGGLKGSGEQRWALAIVPTPVVAPDRVIVSDRAGLSCASSAGSKAPPSMRAAREVLSTSSTRP